MIRDPFFDKIDELKLKFDKFFQHRKKMKAVMNYSFLKNLNKKQAELFKCIQICLDLGFLKGSGEAFLDELLKDFDIFYLDWCHRTKWVKEKMQIAPPIKQKKVIKTRIVAEQTYFDFEKLRVDIPLQVIVPNKPNSGLRV